MLKLRHLPLVNQIACTRDELVGKLRAVREGRMVITIDGNEREDAEMVRLARPTVERELAGRIARLDEQLRLQGCEPNG